MAPCSRQSSPVPIVWRERQDRRLTLAEEMLGSGRLVSAVTMEVVGQQPKPTIHFSADDQLGLSGLVLGRYTVTYVMNFILTG